MRTITTLFELLGLVAIVAGLWIALGLGWGLVALGVLLLFVSWLVAPRKRPAGGDG